MDLNVILALSIFDYSSHLTLDSVQYPFICPRIIKIVSANYHRTEINEMCR